MMNEDQLYRYLQFKAGMWIRPWQRPRMIQGLRLCRVAKIPIRKLKQVTDTCDGLCSFGPVDLYPAKTGWTQCVAYARRNGFGATIRYTFTSNKRSWLMGRIQYLCIKERPYRKGIYHRPRR